MVTDEVEQAVSDQAAGFVVVRQDPEPHDCHSDLHDAVRRLERPVGLRSPVIPSGPLPPRRVLGLGSEWHCPKCGSRWRKMCIVLRIRRYLELETFTVGWYRVRWWHHKKG